MQKTYCDRCKKETINFPHSTVSIERGFLFKKEKSYSLCEECDVKLNNLVTKFLNEN